MYKQTQNQQKKSKKKIKKLNLIEITSEDKSEMLEKSKFSQEFYIRKANKKMMAYMKKNENLVIPPINNRDPSQNIITIEVILTLKICFGTHSGLRER